MPSGICQPSGFHLRISRLCPAGGGRTMMMEYLFADLEMTPELRESTLTGAHFNFRYAAPLQRR
ncbi:MAG: hypothetical protein R3A10_11475 [Caldilineaceae bacterium]